jgi:hypothetical protein
MDELRLPSALENSRRVLIAGAGGGFDVYAGLPIYERLRLLGKTVFLANLSFVSLGATSGQALTRDAAPRAVARKLTHSDQQNAHRTRNPSGDARRILPTSVKNP